MQTRTSGIRLCATTGIVNDLGRLHDLCNRDIDHHVEEELGNLSGPTNSLDDGNRPLHHDSNNDDLHHVCNRDIDHRVEE